MMVGKHFEKIVITPGAKVFLSFWGKLISPTFSPFTCCLSESAAWQTASKSNPLDSKSLYISSCVHIFEMVNFWLHDTAHISSHHPPLQTSPQSNHFLNLLWPEFWVFEEILELSLESRNIKDIIHVIYSRKEKGDKIIKFQWTHYPGEESSQLREKTQRFCHSVLQTQNKDDQ